MTPSPAPLRISIDGKTYPVRDEDQEVTALLRMGGRDPKTWDIFLVARNGVEEKIADARIVNLKDGQRFVTRQKIWFTIDGERHRTYDDDQSAAALLRLAGVDPASYDLARVVDAGAAEEFKDEQVVKIKNGDEFVTAKRVGGVA